MKSKLKPTHRQRHSPAAYALKAKLVRIGNSRGVRLPKTVIEQAGLASLVEIAVHGKHVVIQSADGGDPRAGWEERIKKALEKQGDEADQDWLAAPLDRDFEQKEWTW